MRPSVPCRHVEANQRRSRKIANIPLFTRVLTLSKDQIELSLDFVAEFALDTWPCGACRVSRHRTAIFVSILCGYLGITEAHRRWIEFV